jgi:murein L,D-transpeptidase YcbB/YkuD
MIAKIVFRLGIAVCFAGAPALAIAQEAVKPAAPAGAGLDAAPNSAAPDPLTPPEPSGPAPRAPGAPEAPPAQPAQSADAAPLPEPDPIAAQILLRLAKTGSKSDAREDIAGLSAFYTENKGQAIWAVKDGLSPKALKAIHEIQNAGDWGLDTSAFSLPANPGAQAAPEALADAELKLSAAVLKYARYARGGRLDPPSISPIIDRRPHIYDPKSVLEAIAAAEGPDAYLRGLHPKNEQFKRLRQALLALGKSSASAQAARIPQGPDLRPGDDHPQIAMIRKRLSADAEGPRDTSYDAPLLIAVNRYQRENGLPVTGIIDRRLRASMNDGAGGGPDENRLRILVNMERWRWMPENLGEFYVWDSVTEQLTRVFDRGKIVLQEKIVVGKPITPTPTFSANMQFIIFNPEWGVPDGIKVNEIAPRLRHSGGGGFLFFGGGSSEVLQRLGGLRVSINGRQVDPDSVDWSSVDIRRYQFIQGAGGKNVLGVVKFRFPNKHDVYMHDTPDRHLFGSAPRAFSHGCMRTQNPLHLAEVLLAHDKGFSPEQIHGMVASGATNEIKLTSQIPVHVAYFTAEADEKGQIHYLPDIYGLDSRVAAALKGQPVHFASDPAIQAEDEGEPRPERGSSYNRPRHRAFPDRRPWNPFEDWN